MLSGLFIRDMLFTEKLDLSFQPGLNVLTGETGAGKSILLDSLGFVLGWRGRADLVREGADRGEVTAEFLISPDHPAHRVLAEAGLPDEGEVLLLRRTNSSDGRKQAFVNDRRCSGEVLRLLSETLVELHGQQDDRGLLNPRGHRELLDQFGGLEGLLTATRHAWRDLRTARKDLKAFEENLAALEADRDYLSHAVGEMSALAPQVGEDEQLDKDRRFMQAAARTRDDIMAVRDALGPNGAESPLADALSRLQDIDDQFDGAFEEPRNALSRALDEIAEADRMISEQMAMMEHDPLRLEQVEERLFALRALARKHKVQPDGLPELAATLSAKLAALEGGVAGLAEAKARVLAMEQAFEKASGTLSKARAQEAKKLDRLVGQELKPLKLEHAKFLTLLETGEPGPDGSDQVTFEVSTNPGAPSGPLNKIASGGELSRFLLALKVALKSGRDVSMIFDEIDRGVGGATADAVGRRLADLAQAGQVLVVTHSPQVAAKGAHHLLVKKSVAKGQTRSDVVPVEGRAREEEIARMLAGETLTDAARAAAAELLHH